MTGTSGNIESERTASCTSSFAALDASQRVCLVADSRPAADKDAIDFAVLYREQHVSRAPVAGDDARARAEHGVGQAREQLGIGCAAALGADDQFLDE